ncbi:hypothetical protein JMJ78_0000971 [Colletotrichum scovillei]|nr:hypothetical protein JMJ78_0000971 [Colletotrichum scovillei]
MDQFKVHPANPELSNKTGNDTPGTACPVPGFLGLLKEEMTSVHEEILQSFKLDHGREIVKMVEAKGQKHVRTYKYGPYRLTGKFTVPENSICTFIPLKSADRSQDLSSPKASYRVGQEVREIVWQTESPFRLPAGSSLFITDPSCRFLMERHVFESQPAANENRGCEKYDHLISGAP